MENDALLAARREKLADEAFLEPSRTNLCGLEIRPFSAGTMKLCRSLGLTIFLGEEQDSLPLDERARQFFTFLFIQSQPVDVVLRLARNPEQLAERVEAFQFELPVDAIPSIAAECERILSVAGAAIVEVEQKPGRRGSEPPEPPNS